MNTVRITSKKSGENVGINRNLDIVIIVANSRFDKLVPSVSYVIAS